MHISPPLKHETHRSGTGDTITSKFFQLICENLTDHYGRAGGGGCSDPWTSPASYIYAIEAAFSGGNDL